MGSPSEGSMAMEQQPIFEAESDSAQIVQIKLATEAEPKVEAVEFAAEQEFLNDEETRYFVTLTKIPVESSGPDIQTPQNPIGILETIGGSLQRVANMEAVLPEETAKEESEFLRKLAESNISSLNMASIESGVLLTRREFNSIIVITARGKIGTSAIKDGAFVWPSQPRVEILKPNDDIRRPQTWERRAATLDETPFSSEDMNLNVDDEDIEGPDRAVSLVYDEETDVTFIGISRGFKFDMRDVRKTYHDRKNNPGDKTQDRRVADNTLTRLKEEEAVDAQGYYKREVDGKIVRLPFKVQNPHEYYDPNFKRARQIAEMEVALFDAVKSVRSRARLMGKASEYGMRPDFSRLVDTALADSAA